MNVTKVWGNEVWVNNDTYCMKILGLNKGSRCSYHYHKLKKETFYVTKGQVELSVGECDKIQEKITMNVGDYITIEPYQCHSFKGLHESVIIESSSKHFDSDSYRIDRSVK